MAQVTLGFSEKVKGWTSFYSFLPEAMVRLNSKFYTFYNGQLYVHDDASAPRNTFYGTESDSKIGIIINDKPSDIKNFRTLEIEGNSAWDTSLNLYQSDETEFKTGAINDTEFIEKEGKFYAHLRRNETITTKGKNVYGIGELQSVAANVGTVSQIPRELTIGDEILRDDSGTATLVGTVTAFDKDLLTITSSAPLWSTGNFIMGRKSTRVEGGYLRGYAMRVDLEKSSTTKEELYAINTRVHNSNR